jgi:hypothetical protein
MRALKRLCALAPLMLAACATQQPQGIPLNNIFGNPLQLLRGEKIAVVSIPKDNRVRTKMESFLAEKMRNHGLDAHERNNLVPNSDSLSDSDLRKAFVAVGMTCVFEVNYTESETMPDGTPKTFHGTLTQLVPAKGSKDLRGFDPSVFLLMLLMK